MTYELAIAITGMMEDCCVQPVEAGVSIGGCCLAPLLLRERIVIWPHQLLVIDRATTPPQIIWRWFRGRVVYQASDQAVVENQHYQPGYRDGLSLVRMPQELEAAVQLGDEVFYSIGEEGVIVDWAIAGKPAHPARLCDDLFPALAAVYREEGA